MSKQQNQFIDDLAQGALLAAKKENCVSSLMGDLSFISKLFSDNPEVKHALQNISVPLEDRMSSLKKVMDGKMEPLSINVMLVLMEKNVLNGYGDLMRSIEKQAREMGNYHICKVVTAVSMTEKSKQNLTQVLEKKFKGEINVTYEIDPNVIGGLSITCGDWRYLGTVQNKLQQLSRHLAN